MRKILLALLVLVMVLATPVAGMLHAQDDPDTDFTGTLKVNSAFTRELPTRDSEWLASIFEDEQLEAIGRNIDGTWFQVRRPWRMTSIGWIKAEYLDFEFNPAFLPLTDLTTGIEGPTPLEADPGFAIFLNEAGAFMRTQPDRTAPLLMPVPIFSTVPILERNQNATWFKVNYRGHVGWIIAFVGRDVPNAMDIPEAPLVVVSTVPVEIIPPEVQLAHIAQLRAFITPHFELSLSLENFWLAVIHGDILPCDPPEDIVEYQYSRADVRELPELDRYAPQMNDAVDYLNAAVDPVQHCGVVTIKEAYSARSAAINARILFTNILSNLRSLEETIH